MNAEELRSEVNPFRAFRKLYKHVLSIESSVGGAGESPVKCVLLIGYFHFEVKNGGFAQYFTNPGGRGASETIRALAAVGAPNQEKMLRSAFSLFESWEKGNKTQTLGEFVFGERGILPELNKLDRLYWASQREVCVACVSFALLNADAFQIQ